jgi:hypothetical protein
MKKLASWRKLKENKSFSKNLNLSKFFPKVVFCSFFSPTTSFSPCPKLSFKFLSMNLSKDAYDFSKLLLKHFEKTVTCSHDHPDGHCNHHHDTPTSQTPEPTPV